MKILPKQIAIVGPDGAGKTTLVQRLEQELKGKNIKILYMPEVEHEKNASLFSVGLNSAKSLFSFLCRHYCPYVEDAVIFDRL